MALRRPWYAFAFAALSITLGSTACSGRNIHQDLTDNPDILVRKWSIQTRPSTNDARGAVEFSHPIVWENTLIYGDQTTGLVSIYPGMQLKRWKLVIKNGVTSPILEEKGTLYLGGGDGQLYSVNAENGHVNWKYDLHNPIVSRPTFAGGRLFVTTSDDTVFAFDAATGKWLWHYRRRSSASATILGAAAPLVDGKEVLAGLSDGFLVALTLEDGQLKWERKLHSGTKFTDVDATPLLENGILYVPSYDGSLFALKREGGDVLWRFDAGGSKQVAIEGDHIYLPSSDGNLYALQKSSGKVLWKFELDRGTPTRVVVTDRYLIFGSSFQYFYVVDKDTGKGLYRYNVGYDSGFYGAPVLSPDRSKVYILSAQGNLLSFLVRQPSKAWRHAVAKPYGF